MRADHLAIRVRGTGYSPTFCHWMDPYFAKISILASTNCVLSSICWRDSDPVYPSCDLTIWVSDVAPGASPSEPVILTKELPHSLSSVTRRNTTFAWSTARVRSDRFLNLNVTDGTSLFCPFTLPAP